VPISVPTGLFIGIVNDDKYISVGPNTLANVRFTLNFELLVNCDNRILLVIDVLFVDVDFLEVAVVETLGLALNIFGIFPLIIELR
jgi:hypothetical protein